MNALWRIVLMRFLRSLNSILAYPPTVPAVSALWCGFVPHLWRSLYGILAFVRRRRLFLIESSYKRTKIHFCAFGDWQQGQSQCLRVFLKVWQLVEKYFFDKLRAKLQHNTTFLYFAIMQAACRKSPCGLFRQAAFRFWYPKNFQIVIGQFWKLPSVSSCFLV